MIESKKEKLLTLDVQKGLVWELMEGWGQLCQELRESFPDKGNDKHKSPEVRKAGIFWKLSKVCEPGGEWG